MAEWEALKIHDVVQDIENNSIVLPVIQRNLVWDEEKMELLFDSLLKGNSFGGIMALEEEKGSQPLFAFRHFSKDGDMLDSDLPPVLDNNTTLIIDGQQRLQAFYMGLKGGVNDKNLYFNLFSQGDYEFEFAGQLNDLPTSRKEDGVEVPFLWYLVQNIYAQLSRVGGDDRRVASEIIQTRNIQSNAQKELIYDNVRQFERAVFGMRALGISKVFIDKTNPDAERRRMVELFRRLNDGGTRLSALDLAASKLKGFDYRLETFLRRDIPGFSDLGFGQDEVIKLIFLLQNNYTKEVTNINKEDADFAIQNAPRILKSLDVLRQLLKDAELYEYYQGGGRSVIPLYFIAYHIFYKPNSVDDLSKIYANHDTNNPDFTNIKRWLYLSLLNGVFSRGKGWVPYITGVRKILNTLSQYQGRLFPTDELLSLYESHPLIFNREISEVHLAHWDMTFGFYLMYNRRNLAGRDIDHIQPKSLLQGKFASEKIHSLSNYQLIYETTNRNEKRAKRLNEWLSAWVKEADIRGYIEKHLIPEDPKYWIIENFDSFLTERSKLIVEKIQNTIPAQSEASTVRTREKAVEKKALQIENMPDGAAKLTPDQRDPEKWLTGLAEKNGYGQEFRQIIETARSIGLHARFQNNWWVAMLTPKSNRRLGLIWVGADRYISFDHSRIAEYLNCPIDEVKKKLNFKERLENQDITRFVENFVSLFSERK